MTGSHGKAMHAEAQGGGSKERQWQAAAGRRPAVANKGQQTASFLDGQCWRLGACHRHAGSGLVKSTVGQGLMYLLVT